MQAALPTVYTPGCQFVLFTSRSRVMRVLRMPKVGCAVVLAAAFSRADSKAEATAEDSPAPARREQVFKAIERGLAVVQKGARNYPSHRKCFACHHQTMPLLGLTEAQGAGRA